MTATLTVKHIDGTLCGPGCDLGREKHELIVLRSSKLEAIRIRLLDAASELQTLVSITERSAPASKVLPYLRLAVIMGSAAPHALAKIASGDLDEAREVLLNGLARANAIADDLQAGAKSSAETIRP